MTARARRQAFYLNTDNIAANAFYNARMFYTVRHTS